MGPDPIAPTENLAPFNRTSLNRGICAQVRQNSYQSFLLHFLVKRTGSQVARQSRARWYFALLGALAIAIVNTALGEFDWVLGLLEKEFEETPVSFFFECQLPGWDPVRNDSRFKSLLSSLRLPNLDGRSEETGSITSP